MLKELKWRLAKKGAIGSRFNKQRIDELYRGLDESREIKIRKEIKSFDITLKQEEIGLAEIILERLRGYGGVDLKTLKDMQSSLVECRFTKLVDEGDMVRAIAFIDNDKTCSPQSLRDIVWDKLLHMNTSFNNALDRGETDTARVLFENMKALHAGPYTRLSEQAHKSPKLLKVEKIYFLLAAAEHKRSLDTLKRSGVSEVSIYTLMIREIDATKKQLDSMPTLTSFTEIDKAEIDQKLTEQLQRAKKLQQVCRIKNIVSAIESKCNSIYESDLLYQKVIRECLEIERSLDSIKIPSGLSEHEQETLQSQIKAPFDNLLQKFNDRLKQMPQDASNKTKAQNIQDAYRALENVKTTKVDNLFQKTGYTLERPPSRAGGQKIGGGVKQQAEEARVMVENHYGAKIAPLKSPSDKAPCGRLKR